MNTLDKVNSLISQMKWSFNVVESSKDKIAVQKKYLSLIGEDADRLSSLIQYFLKFGEEE